jgi:1,4-alpha-glucan branching enzyme
MAGGSPTQKLMTNFFPPFQLAGPVPGMGAIPTEKGVAFRVWAPNADSISVSGKFNDWSLDKDRMVQEDNGNWYAEIKEASPGDEYEYIIHRGEQVLHRNDPRSRAVTNSVGKSIIYADTFDWGDADFKMPPWNELVIYELHIGTFARHDPEQPGNFDDAIQRLPYLKFTGINAVEVMPVSEFAGDLSWGYNPANPYTVESVYGGPDGFKRFIKAAHKLGIAVILDVVYNHFGPSDLDLWQFDGWSENNKGGIYFYNDGRSQTPWGDTRPDYGRGEVRQYIFDNAMMWLEEYRVDGLRYDMTLYIRTISGAGDEIPEGWGLVQWINREVSSRYPGRITIAEDLRNNAYVTARESEGGANFNSQWDAEFVHPIRKVITEIEDEHRDMEAVRSALLHRYNLDVMGRVVYTESHDEVANGSARVTYEIDPQNPQSWYALKRSTLGAGLVLTAPGIPMLFQGQTVLEDGWFQDTDPLDWDKMERFPGVSRLYRDLIYLRLNREGHTKGLTGSHITVHHVNQEHKMVAYHRCYEGGPGDHCLIVANFSSVSRENYRIGLPVAGCWRCRFNSDWNGYREDLGSFPAHDIMARDEVWDQEPASGDISIGAYSLLIYSLEAS